MASIGALEWPLVSGEDIGSHLSGRSPELALSVQQGDFSRILNLPLTQSLLATLPKSDIDFHATLRDRIDILFPGSLTIEGIFELLLVGIAALNAFVQSNITGPPLPFVPEEVVLPGVGEMDRKKLNESIIRGLAVEGEAAYHLIPHVILFAVARAVLNHSVINVLETGRWWRLRVNFLHQRMLDGEKTRLLHDIIYTDLNYLSPKLLGHPNKWIRARFLAERALVNTYFGYDKAALQGLEMAAHETGMEYALTGVMGKRTKFQEKDTSQLVVLAKSAEDYKKPDSKIQVAEAETKPKTLDLSDDTLLETIIFTENPSKTTTIQELLDLPKSLAELDPNSQTPLHPLDGTILLLLTETINNTNPATGLTREEMTPYAERVLTHPTNWEVYTIALLVRSRIEGYKSRTAERGLLQLQALVDQIIADTTQASHGSVEAVTTFLPRPNGEGGSAPVRERLEYVYQLAAPTRWEVEAELAQRWVTLGGLRTALEIYQRLQMWAEMALCYAATENEGKARVIVRNQLLEPVVPAAHWQTENEHDQYKPTPEEEEARKEIDPPPTNAPRLWSLLGDIDKDPTCYERAWEISNHRYARAKRSLGQYWFSKKEFLKSAEAYADSLNINQLNSQSWFYFGCCRMQLEDWEGGVEAFQRCTMLDDADAEAWSNLASCLLRRRTLLSSGNTGPADDDEENISQHNDREPGTEGEVVIGVGRNRRDALKALKRACSLKYDNWRMWENLLIIAASIPEYSEVVMAFSRLIELRGGTAGETCVDVEILERLVQHTITTTTESESTTTTNPTPRQSISLLKKTIDLIEKQVVPLITKQERLWLLCARLALFRKRPKEALELQEKAFRVVTHGYDVGERTWKELVDATVDMVDAYTSLGEMEREGLASGSGELVAKNWKFKARLVVRSAMGKGKLVDEEGGEGWERLESVLEGLKA